MEGLCADTFSSGPGRADPSLTLGDTCKCPDDDDGGIDNIESDTTLNTPVGAGCVNTGTDTTHGADNELLELALPMASVTVAMLGCALVPFTEVVSSKCPVAVLRADDFLSGTTGAEPSLAL